MALFSIPGQERRMISPLWKLPDPAPPGQILQGAVPPTAVVGGVDSVPVELHFQNSPQPVQAGIDIVFLIDHSGSMKQNDPDNDRFTAIKDLISEFATNRDTLDRIAVLTCSGTNATMEQSWHSWTDTEDTVQTLLDSPGSGGTPLAIGMKAANDLLIASNGLYKLVILLSDGWPTADDLTDTPVEAITDPGGLCEQAFLNRILYSTIYLTVADPPDDSAFLKYIARATDYITDYPTIAADPQYYFRVTDTSGFLAGYRGLFDYLTQRASVPQSLILREEVDDRLNIDSAVPVTFSGSGFAENQNVIAFGPEAHAQGITATSPNALAAALDLFRENRVFEIHLNELDGAVTLRFAVKLNLDAIDPSDYPGDRICIDVDSDPGIQSYIEYLEPTGVQGSVRVKIPTPQARICFMKGLSVRKAYNPALTGDLVKIECANLDLNPIEWLEIAECPSGFLDVSGIEDDCGFKPFGRLLDHLIIPWFLEHFEHAAREQYPHFDTVPRQTLNNIRIAARSALRSTFGPLLPHEDLIDSCLRQFQFVEETPEPAQLDRFWDTVNQRGIYSLVEDFPPLATRTISFRISDASYLKTSVPDQVLSWYVDACFPKWGINHTMSWYNAVDMQSTAMVLPNPSYHQMVSSNDRPDLFTGTCFFYQDVAKLRELFSGSSTVQPWKMLNSVDMQPIWEQNGRVVGLSVKVHNAGGQTASSKLHARSYILPFTGEEPNLDFGQNAYHFNVHPPLIGSGEIDFNDLESMSTRVLEVHFHRLNDMSDGSTVDYAYLQNVQNAIIISIAEIEPAEDELMLGNNKAIEIATLRS
ncbi:VWA domain-containing protein [Gemmatimonadota bacterium]